MVSRRGTWAGLAIPVVIAMLSMIGPFSIDTPFPAFPQMADDFRVEASQMQLVVTTYLGSFALMSVFHGPLSDAVGRRPVMLVSCGVYALASVGAALSPSLPVLLAFRALQGLSAGGSTIVSRTLVRDLSDGPEAQRLMSRVAVIFSVAPAIAPVIGGLLLQAGPWPLEFWFMAALGLVLIAAILVVLPETHPEHLRTPLRIGAIVGGLSAVPRRRGVPPRDVGDDAHLRRAVPLHRRRGDLRRRAAGAGRARLLEVLRADGRRADARLG